MAIRADVAMQEIARRELARLHFADYARYMLPEPMAAIMQPFHLRVCELLEDVLRFIMSGGEEGTGRLMLFMPPRYWKTLLTSRLFPSWALGKHPDLQIITTSYSGKMAFKNSRNCRDFAMSQKYTALFGKLSEKALPVEISRDVQAVEEWRLAAPFRGGSWAAGAGGSLTGEGAHLFLLDDPFKDRKEAESASKRDDLWDWYNDVVKTRLEAGGSIVIPQTRWHPDGISGRLLRDMVINPLADKWTVLSLMGLWEPTQMPEGLSFEEFHDLKLADGVWVDEADPMERRPGEALWPLKQDSAELEAIRSVNPYGFESLYQQQPYLRSGDFFKREWFVIVGRGPKPEDVVRRMRLWDKAGSKTGKGDYTVGVEMSLTKGGMIYVEHVARQRGRPKERDDLMLRIGRADLKRKGPRVDVWHQQDPGTAGLDSAQATNRMLAAAGIRAHFETMTGDKQVRAGPWSSAMEGDQVRLVRGGWNQAYIDEHAGFPEGRYDDQVDASSWGYGKLAGGVVRESRIW